MTPGKHATRPQAERQATCRRDRTSVSLTDVRRRQKPADAVSAPSWVSGPRLGVGDARDRLADDSDGGPERDLAESDHQVASAFWS
jgi:hypothetical protein